MYAVHDATSQAEIAACSESYRSNILNNPDNSNNRVIDGWTAHNTIFPPSWEIRLIRPSMTPKPELSMKVSWDKFNTKSVYKPVDSSSSIRVLSCSAV